MWLSNSLVSKKRIVANITPHLHRLLKVIQVTLHYDIREMMPYSFVDRFFLGIGSDLPGIWRQILQHRNLWYVLHWVSLISRIIRDLDIINGTLQTNAGKSLLVLCWNMLQLAVECLHHHHHHLALQPYVSLALLCYSPPLVPILSFPSPSPFSPGVNFLSHHSLGHSIVLNSFYVTDPTQAFSLLCKKYL